MRIAYCVLRIAYTVLRIAYCLLHIRTVTRPSAAKFSSLVMRPSAAKFSSLVTLRVTVTLRVSVGGVSVKNRNEA